MFLIYLLLITELQTSPDEINVAQDAGLPLLFPQGVSPASTSKPCGNSSSLNAVGSQPPPRAKATVPVWQAFIQLHRARPTQQNLDRVNGKEVEKEEGERGEWECVLRGLVQVVGTAGKGRAAPAGIHEAAVSTQGDEQPFPPGCWCSCSPLPTEKHNPALAPVVFLPNKTPRYVCWSLKGSAKWELCRFDSS